MKKTVLFLSILMLWAVGDVGAQTLHAICFANTLDDGIGADVDMKNFKNQMATLEQYIGYKVKFYEYPGEICKKNNLENCLANLSTGSDDIIFFYYSGHGGRPVDYQDPFPFMCLTENYSTNFVSVASVRNLLQSKTARLKIIFTDCCNSSGSGEEKDAYSKGATMFKSSASDNFRKLFLSVRGEIVVTSSKAGQSSLGSASKGGLLTRSFFSVLIDVGNGVTPPDWETILKKSKDMCEPKQTPYWVINTNSTQQASQIVSQPHQNVVASNQNDFSSMMLCLIDPNKKITEKFQCVDNIMNTFFVPNAEIVVVGQDLETVVRRKKAKTYLQELCTTPNILQVNVLYEENAANSSKIEFMVVHEIYKPKTYQ